MADVKSMYYRYFMYSAEEESLKQKIKGVNAKFGEVMVRGIPKRYTTIESDPNNARADAIVVYKGDIRKAKYTTA